MNYLKKMTEMELAKIFGISDKERYQMKLEYHLYVMNFFKVPEPKLSRVKLLKKELDSAEFMQSKLISFQMAYSGNTRDFVDDWMIEVCEEIKKLERQIYFYKNKKEGNVDFEQAKLFPILELFANYGLSPYPSGNNRFKCICPFHQEKTASLMIYADKNNWHCFGCSAGSSTIDFVMNMEKCSSLEAAKKLTN